MSNGALNFGSGNHYRSKLQIFLESENLTQIAIQIKGKMSKHWPSEHRLTEPAHLSKFEKLIEIHKKYFCILHDLNKRIIY